MFRQKRSFRQIALSLPLAFLLLIGWSLGEMLGYLSREPELKTVKKFISLENSLNTDQPNSSLKL